MSSRNRILPLFIPHLGCPHACVFCNQKQISGTVKPVTPAEVSAAIEALSPEQYGLEVAFYGGSFTALPVSEQRGLLEAVQPFLRKGAVSAIRLSTRPDAVDEAVCDLLQEMHVTTVELGAQSMSDAVLQRSGRGHTAEDTRCAANLLRQRGFHLILQMMTGLPGSDRRSDIQTAEELASLQPDGVRIYPTVILRDTLLFDMWKNGEYPDHTVEDAVAVCAEILPVFESAGITVIRLGLNPTDDLSGGSAAAGAYHPALGELVQNRLFCRRAGRLFRDSDRECDAVLAVCSSDLSKMIGQHRCNIKKLSEQYGLRSLRILPDDRVAPGKVRRIDATAPEGATEV